MGEMSSDPMEFMTTEDWGVEPIDVMPRKPLKARRIRIDNAHSYYFLWEVQLAGDTERLTDGEFVLNYEQV
jgi:hypothetical protein